MGALPSAAEIAQSLAAAVRLMLFRGSGFAYLPRTYGAVWRSFFAMVLAAPAFAVQLTTLPPPQPGGELHFFVIWALTYVSLWFAFPVALLLLGERQPFAARIPVFLLAANWVSVPASYLATAAVQLLPGVEGLDYLLFAWLLANEWWLLRRILAIGPLQATALVLLSRLIFFAFYVFALSRTLPPGWTGA